MSETNRPDEQEILSEFTVESEMPDAVDSTEIVEDVEQISKSIAVGRKEVYYEDGSNFISVIINAISVHINMPRGTIKATIACFLAFLLCVCIYGLTRVPSRSEEEPAAETTEDAATVLPARDVTISENYSYTVPAGFAVEKTDLEGSWFSNAKAYGFYADDGKYYLVRSYIAAKTDGEIRDAVLSRLKTAYDVEDIRHEYIDMDFGRVVAYSFEIVADGQTDIHAVEYSWADDDGSICSIEVSSESDYLMDTAQTILTTVHRSENDYTNEELLAINTNNLAISGNYRYHLPDNTYNVEGPYNDYFANEYWVDFEFNKTHYAIRSYAIMEAGSGDLEKEIHSMMEADGYIDVVKEDRLDTAFGNVLRVEFETEDRDGVALKVIGFYWYDSEPTICCLELSNDTGVDAKVEDMLLKLVYKKSGSNRPSEPDSYVYEPNIDEAMKSEIEDAWREYNEPKPDITDRVIKP